mmetsp:Transcript_11087/g.25202  ORF Transcript_11087/g.25202 Transcript_11087/m.25202 type:complete len:324 (+) Transcript_11087:1173-2144(+)
MKCLPWVEPELRLGTVPYRTTAGRSSPARPAGLDDHLSPICETRKSLYSSSKKQSSTASSRWATPTSPASSPASLAATPQWATTPKNAASTHAPGVALWPSTSMTTTCTLLSARASPSRRRRSRLTDRLRGALCSGMTSEGPRAEGRAERAAVVAGAATPAESLHASAFLRASVYQAANTLGVVAGRRRRRSRCLGIFFHLLPSCPTRTMTICWSAQAILAWTERSVPIASTRLRTEAPTAHAAPPLPPTPRPPTRPPPPPPTPPSNRPNGPPLAASLQGCRGPVQQRQQRQPTPRQKLRPHSRPPPPRCNARTRGPSSRPSP